jgi:hypothetical protein
LPSIQTLSAFTTWEELELMRGTLVGVQTACGFLPQARRADHNGRG